MSDQLRQLQLVETDMLGVFDRICRRHNIPYFIAFGTAIGAVRHQGFIPWDDDIDLAMLRKDFDRLREVPQDEWEGLELVTAGDMPYYHERIFPRVYKPGTVFETEAWHDTHGSETACKPLWLDLFLYDYYDTEEEAIRKMKISRKYQRLYYSCKYTNRIGKKGSVTQIAKTLVNNIVHTCVSIFMKPDDIVRKYEQQMRKDEGKHLISYDMICNKEVMESRLEVEDVFPTADIRFESLTVMTARDTDKELRQYFGDYMKLPPENERVAHLPRFLQLGDQ